VLALPLALPLALVLALPKLALTVQQLLLQAPRCRCRQR
jgi:hypothetical protein